MKKSIVPFTDAEERFIERLVQERTKAGQRFPLAFAMFVTFGFVATLYGFEGLIDRIDILANNPWILLATGIGTLVATGTLYQKLN